MTAKRTGIASVIFSNHLISTQQSQSNVHGLQLHESSFSILLSFGVIFSTKDIITRLSLQSTYNYFIVSLSPSIYCKIDQITFCNRCDWTSLCFQITVDGFLSFMSYCVITNSSLLCSTLTKLLFNISTIIISLYLSPIDEDSLAKLV